MKIPVQESDKSNQVCADPPVFPVAKTPPAKKTNHTETSVFTTLVERYIAAFECYRKKKIMNCQWPCAVYFLKRTKKYGHWLRNFNFVPFYVTG